MLQRSPVRQVESEGILRLLVLAAAIAMPLGCLAYMKIQSTRISYEMAEVRARIQKEEEAQRKLMLERSRFQRQDEVQGYAQRAGLQPRKQSHVIHRAFTAEDQRIAKLRPVSSEEFLR